MHRPKVVLAMAPMFTLDLFREDHFERLAGCAELLDRERWTDLTSARAAELLAEAEILLSSWGCPPLDAAVLAQAPRLRANVHAAGTVKMHITDDCWARGLRVSSAAAANAVPVAEYTLGAILLANKAVFPIQRRYQQERGFLWWPAEFPGLGNYRKTVGIVGASFVGRKVIEWLRPFDFQVLVYDPFLPAEGAEELGVRKVELDELMQGSDIVSLHAPALLETRRMISREMLASMRDGATLINTARGWLVDEPALEAELVKGRLRAVIDTTEPEILPAESPLYDLPNVFLTPHIAGAMGAETQRMATLAIDEIERYSRGECFCYEVTRADLARIA